MLTLDGSWKDLGNANMSGWINVGPGGRLYIERFARLINTFNNEKNPELNYDIWRYAD